MDKYKDTIENKIKRTQQEYGYDEPDADYLHGKVDGMQECLEEYEKVVEE